LVGGDSRFPERGIGEVLPYRHWGLTHAAWITRRSLGALSILLNLAAVIASLRILASQPVSRRHGGHGGSGSRTSSTQRCTAFPFAFFPLEVKSFILGPAPFSNNAVAKDAEEGHAGPPLPQDIALVVPQARPRPRLVRPPPLPEKLLDLRHIRPTRH